MYIITSKPHELLKYGLNEQFSIHNPVSNQQNNDQRFKSSCGLDVIMYI